MVGQAGGAGGSGPAKRGRPAVNASNNNADAPGVAGVGAQPTLGPSIQVHSGFAGMCVVKSATMSIACNCAPYRHLGFDETMLTCCV